MTAVTFFGNDIFNGKIDNLVDIHNNTVFDTQINSPYTTKENKFSNKSGLKSFIWQNSIPFSECSINNQTSKLIKFNCIHFQGQTKYLINKYYKGNNYKGKFKLDCLFLISRVLLAIVNKFKVKKIIHGIKRIVTKQSKV